MSGSCHHQRRHAFHDCHPPHRSGDVDCPACAPCGSDVKLRWFTTVNGEDQEVDGPGPHIMDGEPIYARSRTFIRATLSDNPDLAGRITLPSWPVSRKNYVAPIAMAISRSAFEMLIFR